MLKYENNKKKRTKIKFIFQYFPSVSINFNSHISQATHKMVCGT
jgi:hypothetical protein